MLPRVPSFLLYIPKEKDDDGLMLLTIEKKSRGEASSLRTLLRVYSSFGLTDFDDEEGWRRTGLIIIIIPIASSAKQLLSCGLVPIKPIAKIFSPDYYSSCSRSHIGPGGISVFSFPFLFAIFSEELARRDVPLLDAVYRFVDPLLLDSQRERELGRV